MPIADYATSLAAATAYCKSISAAPRSLTGRRIPDAGRLQPRCVRVPRNTASRASMRAMTGRPVQLPASPPESALAWPVLAIGELSKAPGMQTFLPITPQRPRSENFRQCKWAAYAAIVGDDYRADRRRIAGSGNKRPIARVARATRQKKATRSVGPRRCTLLQEATAYFPSRSESPGTARSIASLTRWNESFVAYFASFHVRRDVPLTRSQSRDRSLSTSSNVLP